MEDDNKLKQALSALTSNTETWCEIKKILEAEIRSKQDLINYIDKLVQEKQEKYSKLN